VKAARISAGVGALLCVLGCFLWWGPEHVGYRVALLGLQTAWHASAGLSWAGVGALLMVFGALPCLAGVAIIRGLHDGRLGRAASWGAGLIAWFGLFAIFEPREELGYGIGLLITLLGAALAGPTAIYVWVRSRAARDHAVASAKAASGTLLVVDNLDVHYGAVHALKGISLEVQQGEIVTLLGGNGAGKTTTLRALSGLVTPSGGRVLLEGREIATRTGALPPDQIVRLGVSHAPEGRGIFANLTVRENLDLGAYQRRDRAVIARDLEHALTLFPRLRERLRQRAGTLSGGEQQMLAIARAMLARPRLLLLDEPSLGLAPTITQVIFQIIRDINKEGTTILLVEQNAHQALKVAHKGYVLETGEIVMHDDAKVLAASDEVRKAYLGVG